MDDTIFTIIISLVGITLGGLIISALKNLDDNEED